MKALRHILRGCKSLPHVGSHPGTPVMLALVFGSFFAGLSKSLALGIIAPCVMAVVMGPIYLVGSYERSKLSDHLEREAKGEG